METFKGMHGELRAVICDGDSTAVGERIESHPATDAWIFGDRFGEVVKIGRKLIHVKMERSGRTLRFRPENVCRIRDYW